MGADLRRDAAVPGGGPRGARRHPAAPQPGARHRAPSAPSGPPSSPRSTTGRSCAAGPRPSRTTPWPTSTSTSLDPRGVAHRSGRHRALGARRRGGLRGRRPGGARPRRRRGGQGQVDGHPGDRAQRGPRRARASPRGRPTSPSSSSSSATTCPATSSSPPSTATAPRSARSSGAGWPPPAARRPTTSPTSPAELAAAARLHLREKFLLGQDGGLRGQLRRRRDRHPRRRRVRGQRPDVPDPARGAGLGRRHREGRAHLGRPRRLPPAAAPLLHRGADEPVHLDVVRGHARRRAAGGARRPPRQRAHPCAGRRGRAAGAALHPLLGLPQRLPRLRAGRRARLRLGLPRARSGPSWTRCCKGTGEDAATDALPYASTLCGACADVCPVGIDIPEVLVHLRSRVVDAHRGDRVPKAEAVAMRAAGWAFGDARRLALGESGAGSRAGCGAGGGCPGAAPRCVAARPGLAVDRRPRPAHAAAGVLPRLVAPHRRGRTRRAGR